MSGVAMAVQLDGHSSFDLSVLRAMVAAARCRAGAGVRERCAGAAAAAFLDGAEEPGLQNSSPVLSDDGSVLLVADARIDNRRDLADLLGAQDAAHRHDDGALLLAAYARWGESFADGVIGDFAVVIWDAKQQRMVAARDRGALRPLVYLIDPGRLLIASDVAQILAARDVPARPNGHRIAAALAGVPGLPEWTYYEGVLRVHPGHTLVVESGRPVREHVHGTPATAPPQGHTRSFEESADALRVQFLEAVRVRLSSTDRPGLLLSGGLDSGAVASAAGWLHVRDPKVPRLHTFSFAYNDIVECDERDVSNIIARHHALPNVVVPADDAWPLAEYPAHGPAIDGPTRFASHVVFERALALAQQDGVRVLMTGQRGDALLGGNLVDYVAQMRRHGVVAVWRDLATHARRAGRSRLALVSTHILRRALVDTAVRVAEAVNGPRVRRPHKFPVWMPQSTIRRYDLLDIGERSRPGFSSRTGAIGRRVHSIRNPMVAYGAEATEHLFSRYGLRYADPWSDWRLAELVMTIPPFHVTPAGESKGLLREAMRGLMPDAARRAATKRPPTAAYARGLLDRSSATVRSLIDDSRLARAGFVDATALRVAYARLQSKGAATTAEWRTLWRFVDTEDWWRRFHDR